MLEIETQAQLTEGQIERRNARAFRDYQLWAGEVTPRQNEWARQRELRKICQGVSYNRDIADAYEETLKNPASAITEIRDEESYCGLEVPPAEDVLGEFPVKIVKVNDLMTEFDNQTGGIM